MINKQKTITPQKLNWEVIYKIKNVFSTTLSVVKFIGFHFLWINFVYMISGSILVSKKNDTKMVKVIKSDNESRLGGFRNIKGFVYVRSFYVSRKLLKVLNCEILNHEIRHAKNSEYGKIPVCMDEISARMAAELGGKSDNIINEEGGVIDRFIKDEVDALLVPYNISYNFDKKPNSEKIDSMLNSALKDWERCKDLYLYNLVREKMFRLTYIKSPFERYSGNTLGDEQKKDSLFTFLINEKRINVFDSATVATRNRIKQWEKPTLRMLFSKTKNHIK